MTKSSESEPDLTVIIPTLNAAKCLEVTLLSIKEHCSHVLIVDGGSQDGTVELAEKLGARTIKSARGRGTQLQKGAQAATSFWLFFLHADSILTTEAVSALKKHCAAPDKTQLAAYFRMKLDDNSEAARRLERRVAWRCKTFALPYGDQGFLISKELYDRLSGYRAIPLMEDVDFIWRLHRMIGKKALIGYPADIITSAERFKRHGYFTRSVRNLICLLLFRLHVPPHLIAKIY